MESGEFDTRPPRASWLAGASWLAVVLEILSLLGLVLFVITVILPDPPLSERVGSKGVVAEVLFGGYLGALAFGFGLAGFLLAVVVKLVKRPLTAVDKFALRVGAIPVLILGVLLALKSIFAFL